jgi:LPXTG-site transpeptidase (sortase) family protein
MSTASTPDAGKPAAPPRRRALKTLEITLFILGGACLAYVAAVRLTGYFGSKQEIARFRSRSAPAPAPAAPAPVAPAVPAPAAPPVAEVEPPPPPPAPVSFPSNVDYRLWSPKRIKEYEASIAERNDGPLAVMRIPNLDIEAAVLPDSTDWALNRGVGWIEGTALPGEPGNVGIAGHRDGFFRGLKDVASGDTIELELPGRVEQYRVSGITIVKPEDVSVLDPTPEPSLTLVTCYPFYFVGSAPERFIVKATRVAAGN